MWKVEFESKETEREVTKMKKNNLFTKAELEILQLWVNSVSLNGPDILRFGAWNDHALTKEWQGYRSSSFSNRGRIIYKVVENRVLIKIARITKEHNYKR